MLKMQGLKCRKIQFCIALPLDYGAKVRAFIQAAKIKKKYS